MAFFWWSLLGIAWSNSGIPELGVYFVNPDSSAAIAAALICSGVSKSGSPAPKPQTSSPSDFIAFALLSTERERDGVRLFAREESCIKPFLTICVRHLFQPRICLLWFNGAFHRPRRH